MSNDLLLPLQQPKIYAYSDVRFPQMLKVGYTTRKVADRIKQHYAAEYLPSEN